MLDKAVWKEFFLSKGFASIVVILATQFGSAELAGILGQGVEFAQNTAITGLLGGAILGLWGRLNSAKTKVEVKETKSIVGMKDAALDRERLLKNDAVRRLKEVEQEAARLRPARNNGKFVKKDK